MASFLQISAELKLSIVEYLEPKKVTHRPSSSERSYHKRDVEAQSLRDLVNLSCVNRELRALVAPYLFKEVTLTGTEKNAESIKVLADSVHAARTLTLHYEPDISDLLSHVLEQNDEPPVGVEEGQFPNCVKHVLEGLSKFSNLDCLTIEFVVKDNNSEDLPDIIDLFGPPGEGGPETNDQVKEAEEEEGWRALMKNSYDAILRSTPNTIRKVELRNLLAKEVSTWRENPTWPAFLSSLETFTLTLRGGSNMLGGTMVIYDEYPKLAANLDFYFFQHLQNATSLHFEATKDGPVGCHGIFNHTEFSFSTTSMPKLQHLKLSYVFISKQLLEGICAHKSTLETIHLSDCLALDTSNWMADLRNPNEIPWAKLFTTIRSASIPKLHSFVVDWVNLPRDAYDWQNDFKKLEDEDPGNRRAFVYANFGDKYGDFWVDKENTQERFEKGEDLRAWVELEKWVRKNRGEVVADS